MYVAFTPEQKLDFWKGKMTEVLSLDWNEQEREHLKSLYKTVSNNSEWFASDFSKNKEQFEQFEIVIYKWSEYAGDILGWDKNLIGSIIASGNKLLDKTGKIFIVKDSSVRLKSGKELDCDCHRGNVLFTTCELQEGFYCKNDPCKESVYGCGAFWTESCNGLCGI
jgi:hypothetical protein